MPNSDASTASKRSDTPGSRHPAIIAAALGLLALATVLELAFRFNAVNKVVLPFLQRAGEPGLYALDFYVAHSAVPRSTPLFSIIDFLRIDLTDPALVIANYVAITLVAAIAVWKIIKTILPKGDTLLCAAMMFVLNFADNKIVNFHKNSWIIEHNFSFTFIAVSLRFWFVYFMLSGRNALMCAMLLPINLFSTKVGWPLCGFALLILLYQRERSPAAWLLLLLSLLPPLHAMLASHVAMSAAEARAIFDVVRAAYPREDNPFDGSWPGNPVFLLGCAFLWHQARAIAPMAVAQVRIVVLASLAIYFFGGLYLALADHVPPIPVVVLLSPARALETACFLIYLAALAWIVRTDRFDGLEKTLLMLAAILFRATGSMMWVGISACFLLAALALAAVRMRWGERGVPPARWLSLPLGIAIASPVVAIGVERLQGDPGRSYRFDDAVGFHDADVPTAALAMLKALAQEPADRRIVFVEFRDGAWRHARWNRIARKSAIEGDPYYLTRIAQMRAQQQRNSLIDRLVDEMNGGRVSVAVKGQLHAMDVTVIGPRQLADKAEGWKVTRRYGDWVELRP